MPLPRFQLFELEDLRWFPAAIRDLATDYLHFMATLFQLHQPVVPLLRCALGQSAKPHVVDLCSGGGGPVLALYEALVADGAALQFTLTDKHPNLPAFRRLARCTPQESPTLRIPWTRPRCRASGSDFGLCSTPFITLIRLQDVLCCSAPSKPGSRSGSLRSLSAQ
jgi:hypothetical protein